MLPKPNLRIDDISFWSKTKPTIRILDGNCHQDWAKHKAELASKRDAITHYRGHLKKYERMSNHKYERMGDHKEGKTILCLSFASDRFLATDHEFWIIINGGGAGYRTELSGKDGDKYYAVKTWYPNEVWLYRPLCNDLLTSRR